VGVQIQIQGDRLILRATLPARPDSSKITPHQQRIYLGVHANNQGLSFAETEARKVGALVDCGDFNWIPYLKKTATASEKVGDWVERFEKNYFEQRQRNHKTETTWRGDYLKVFNKLPQDVALTADVLRDAIVATTPDSKSRKRAAMVIGAMCKFAGIDLDVRPLAGRYSSKSVQPKSLPTDDEIAAWWGKISNSSYRWVYGMMACYGLRPHEVLHVNLETLRAGNCICEVTDGKTGERYVWPCYPEWFEQFNLSEVDPPKINLERPNYQLGKAIGNYFRQGANIPFHPYALRHAWAIRTIEFRLPLELAARQMGHSVVEHTKTYHRWIKPDFHQRAYEALMLNADRPQPPTPQQKPPEG
jgi:integrase